MAIKQVALFHKDAVLFSFSTKAEGLQALKTAIEMVAGECGHFTFLPREYSTEHLGYLGFRIKDGDINALAGVTSPFIRAELLSGLGITSDELDAIVSPYIRQHYWFTRRPQPPCHDETQNITFIKAKK